jgi:hypothetical protein
VEANRRLYPVKLQTQEGPDRYLNVIVLHPKALMLRSLHSIKIPSRKSNLCRSRFAVMMFFEEGPLTTC